MSEAVDHWLAPAGRATPTSMSWWYRFPLTVLVWHPGNGLLGPNYSSKFSPWLATGSVSPRVILKEIKRYEAERVANDSTYW